MRSLVFALCAIVSATSSSASLLTTGVTGRVTSGGSPVSDVSVTISSPVLQHVRRTVTTVNGRWWSEALPPGPYRVTFEKRGFQSLTRQVVVELARVSRLDAVLEPGDDEDLVTSSAITLSVTETQPITTHLSDATIDRMPVWREPSEVSGLAPLFFAGPNPSGAVIDGISSTPLPTWLGQEMIEEVTVLRGALPVEESRLWGTASIVQTRSPRNSLFLSLRGTVSSDSWRRYPASYGPPAEGVQHFLEAAGGGPLLRDHLWLFASVWGGEKASRSDREVRGGMAKLSAQIGAAHNVVASYIDGSIPNRSRDQSQAAIRYLAVPTPRLTIQTLIGRSTGSTRGSSSDLDSLFAKSSYLLPTRRAGDHLLSIGGTATRLSTSYGFERDKSALFVDDRWTVNRWVLHIGARYESEPYHAQVMPRFSVTRDLLGDGRHALTATYGEYGPVRESTAGFASVFGATGRLRFDYVRQEDAHVLVNGGMAEIRYRIFDRFEIGGNGAIANTNTGNDRRGRAWVSAALPIGEHEVGVTVMERYFRSDFHDHVSTTDLGLRYSVPTSRFTMTAAVDVVGLFDEAFSPREIRGWLRLRV